MLKFGFLFCFFFAFNHLALCQEASKLSYEYINANFRYGSIIKHSPAYWPTITQPTFSGDIDWGFRPKKGNTFFEKFNYPALQFSFNFFKFGDDSVFGMGYSAMPYFNFFLVEKPAFELHTLFGFGLAYITKTHEQVPINNVIGTHFNFSVNADIFADFKVSEKFWLEAGVGIHHFSNGHLKLPNLGINYGYARIGGKYLLKNNYHKDSFTLVERRYFQTKNVFMVCPGVSDKGTQDENRIVPTIMVGYNHRFHTSPHNALLAGATFEYKNNEYDYKIYGFWNNSDLALVVGDELIFGRVSLNANLGIYLYSPTQHKKYVYQRYGFNYQFPIQSSKIELGIGGNLKSHFGAAELLEAKIFLGF